VAGYQTVCMRAAALSVHHAALPCCSGMFSNCIHALCSHCNAVAKYLTACMHFPCCSGRIPICMLKHARAHLPCSPAVESRQQDYRPCHKFLPQHCMHTRAATLELTRFSGRFSNCMHTRSVAPLKWQHCRPAFLHACKHSTRARATLHSSDSTYVNRSRCQLSGRFSIVRN
jgi:hypothetical protein